MGQNERQAAAAGGPAPRDMSRRTAAIAGTPRSCAGAEIPGPTPPDQAPAGSIGAKSGRGGAGRRVVRRSEPLGETPATEPSFEIEVSTPSTTTDTSRPSATQTVPEPSVGELVLSARSECDHRTLLDGGTPGHELSSSAGPLPPEVRLTLREVLVTQYVPAAWRSHLAWHAYCSEHDYDTLSDALRGGSPPRPRSDHRTVRLTWWHCGAGGHECKTAVSAQTDGCGCLACYRANHRRTAARQPETRARAGARR